MQNELLERGAAMRYDDEPARFASRSKRFLYGAPAGDDLRIRLDQIAEVVSRSACAVNGCGSFALLALVAAATGPKRSLGAGGPLP
jgi:hypothetical protein